MWGSLGHTKIVQSPEHKAKKYCCVSHARHLAQGNFKQWEQTLKSVSTCLDLLLGKASSDSPEAVFLKFSQFK